MRTYISRPVQRKRYRGGTRAIWRVSLACSVNEVDKDCVENTLLSKVYKALDAQDNEALDEAANACVGLVGSFKA